MQNFGPLYFPLFFAALWLSITTLLGFLSGWYSLAQRYPNQKEEALLILRGQSGSMGVGVRMNNILRLSVCPSGLRIGIMKIFGPFCRDFFVPWETISVERKKVFFVPLAELRFGHPSNGRLALPEHIANRLAKAAEGNWPEKEFVPTPTRDGALKGVFLLWFFGTIFASAFFIVVPRLVGPSGTAPPWWIAIGFPASVLGAASIFRYWSIVRGSKD